MMPFYKLFNSQPCGDSHIADDATCRRGERGAVVKPGGKVGARARVHLSQAATLLKERGFELGSSHYDAEGKQTVYDVKGSDGTVKKMPARDIIKFLSNSQPCGDSHIPDGATCHVGQGEAPTRRDGAGQAPEQRQAEDRAIAKTILKQIIAGDKWALGAWGAKNLVPMAPGRTADGGYRLGGVTFSVNTPKLSHGKVRVSLMSDDTYTVESGRVRLGEWKTIGKKTDIYYDKLTGTIDSLIENRKEVGRAYGRALQAFRNSQQCGDSFIADGLTCRQGAGNTGPDEKATAVIEKAKADSANEFPLLARMSSDELKSEIREQFDRKPMDTPKDGEEESAAKSVLKETSWPDAAFKPSNNDANDLAQDVRWVRDYTAKAIASGDKAAMRGAVKHFNDLVRSVKDEKSEARRDKADAEWLASSEGKAEAKGEAKFDANR